MDSKEPIFGLTLDQVAIAKGVDGGNAPYDLRPWIENSPTPSGRNSWTPIFMMEVGGPLLPGAIIDREYGIYFLRA
jgi:hypothetical protein